MLSMSCICINEGKCDRLLPLLDTMHQIYEVRHRLLDIHPELVGLAYLLPIVNLYEISGYT